jgi:hypothetical protein
MSKLHERWRREYEEAIGRVFSGTYEEWLEARMQEKTRLIVSLDARIEALERELGGIALVSKGPHLYNVLNWAKVLGFIHDKASAALAAEENQIDFGQCDASDTLYASPGEKNP